MPNRYWWRFAQALGWVNARVLLTLFFALMLTPVGVIMRLFGRRPLRPPRADELGPVLRPAGRSEALRADVLR